MTTTTKTGVQVTWVVFGADVFDGTHEVRRGILTTDHAASSYGLPVVVGEDSTVYGPGDLTEIETASACGALVNATKEDLAGTDHHETAELLKAAKSAGWKITR